MKFDKKIKIIALTFVSLIFVLGEISSLTVKKIEADLAADSQRHKAGHKAHSKAKSEAHSSSQSEAKTLKSLGPQFNATNNTLSNSLFKDLNNTFVKEDLNTFKTSNRRWIDNKLTDKQLEDIYHDLLFKQNSEISPEGVRTAIKLFVSQFEACDSNKDNVLNLQEFTGCMANDTYLSQIKPPHAKFAAVANYSFTNATGFYPILYNVMDSFNLNYTNFHDYMLLRLFAFSWRKCSVNAPYIEETAFECAIEIATGSKTLSRNSARRLYQLSLDLSNGSDKIRNIDFISYVIIAQSARLYGKINSKEDGDATRGEFNLALDSNLLPSRYNQDVVNQLFTLVEEADRPNQGVDLLSFVFYDFALRLFELPTAQKKWSLAPAEFLTVLNHFLFPSSVMTRIKNIPQNNFTSASYQMYTYLNISNYHQEADYFLKFSQISEQKKVNSGSHERAQLGGPKINMTFNSNLTSQRLFNMLDFDRDGFISFYDFGNFFQIAYLFAKFDAYGHNKVIAGDLFDKLTTYNDFPAISYHVRQRAHRFNLFPQDLYIDLMRAVLILRIDDVIKANVRRVDPSTLYEVELKSIFAACDLGKVPDGLLNKCLRGVDDSNVPKYDWECAFINAITATSKYLESSYDYLVVKAGNLTLANTQFVNVDPQIK